MRHQGIALVSIMLACSLFMATPAQAADSPTISDEDISKLFSAYCIERFPDHAAVSGLAQASNATALTPNEVRRYLHDDPGHGWQWQAEQATYVLTLEDPPYHTCAVRRLTPSGINTLEHFQAAITTYTANKHGKLMPAQQQRGKGPGDADIIAFYYPVLDSAGKPGEAFMTFMTNYHGHLAPGWKDLVGSGPGIEIRLVRQIMTPVTTTSTSP